MDDIIPPSPIESAIKPDGSMFQRFRDWTQAVTRAINLSTVATGSGSPEGSISGFANKFYTDTSGPSLYWKSVDDVNGDKTAGWLLVV